MTGTPTHNSWVAMMSRCTWRGHHAWLSYGGRGICVCKRWLDFRNFLDDMGERPEGMTLDRIDNNGNYRKSNCRWISLSQQQSNMRRNHLITFRGKTKHISGWAKKYGLNPCTLRSRILNGWPLEKAMETPTQKR